MPNAPLTEVRAQYEDFPYPPRDPAEERGRLLETTGDFLDIVNFYCFGGRQAYSTGFRTLVAGCGTGDSVVFLAEQLRATGGEVVALDFSEATLAIARMRCEARALANVRFVRAAIQDLPGLALGDFDFINCLGVLHHLADPDEGLRTLVHSLKDSGGMNLMVYATYGRAPIYPVQELLRRLAGPELQAHERIRRARALIAQLPQTNAFKRNFESVGIDIIKLGDAGLYDLLLHAQDRPFRVPEVYDWLAQAGLKLAGFESARVSGKIAYDPASYIRDSELRDVIARKPLAQQHAIAELVAGDMSRHFCYATKREIKPPAADDPAAIPFIPAMWAERDIYRELYEQMESSRKRGNPVTVCLGDPTAEMTFKMTRIAVLFMKHLDGERDMRELCERVKRDLVPAPGSTTPSDEDLVREFSTAFDGFFRSNWMLFRYPGSRPIPSNAFLQRQAPNVSAPK